MTLTKIELLDSISNKLELSGAETSKALEIILEIIKKSLENGEDILISGFGKFCVKQKKARMGRNPATNKDMMLDPRKVVTFKCSGKLREQINAE